MFLKQNFNRIRRPKLSSPKVVYQVIIQNMFASFLGAPRSNFDDNSTKLQEIALRTFLKLCGPNISWTQLYICQLLISNIEHKNEQITLYLGDGSY